jgi:hypothetical protein
MGVPSGTPPASSRTFWSSPDWMFANQVLTMPWARPGIQRTPPSAPAWARKQYWSRYTLRVSCPLGRRRERIR